MRTKIHVSWIIAWISSGLIIGIAMSYWWPGFGEDYWLIIALGLAAIAVIMSTRFAVICAIFAGVLFGLFRGSIDQESLAKYQLFYDKEVKAQGIVSEDVELSPQGNLQVKISQVTIDNTELPHTVWISTSSDSVPKRSDRIVVVGQLKEGFGSFPAAIYRADLMEINKIDNADIARETRDTFANAVRDNIAEPMASLGLGFLVGQRSALPEDLTEKLRILGLTHIVVASGYNLTILVRFTRKLLAGISKYLSVVAGLALTSGFILVTGFSPSMTRAGLITTICLLAWYFGRAVHPFILLAFSAAVTALFNPAYVWGDLGWYLSFAAFGGVIVLAPLITSYFWGEKKPNSLVQILIETSSAILVTVPIIAFSFGQYAPLALISNLLILPLVPLAMVATFVVGLSALMLPGGLVTNMLSIPAELIMGYMVWITDRLSQLPIAISEVSFGLPALLASYVLIFALIVFLIRRTKHSFKEDNIVI